MLKGKPTETTINTGLYEANKKQTKMYCPITKALTETTNCTR